MFRNGNTGLLSGIFLTSLMALPVVAEEAADPVLTHSDRYSINWGTNKISFYGFGDEGSFAKSDAEAWSEGMRYLVQSLGGLREKYVDSNADRNRIVLNRVSSSVYRVKTTFLPHGSIKIDMESRLSGLFAPEGDSASPQEVEEGAKVLPRSTFLVVVLDKPITPSPVFVIRAGEEIVYSLADVDRKSFETNMMGRYFQAPREDLGRANSGIWGQEFIKIEGSVFANHIMVDPESWGRAVKGNESLLNQGRVALLMPEVNTTPKS